MSLLQTGLIKQHKPNPSYLNQIFLLILQHSNVREFMCDTCGRQFKRKDKLKEHVKRIHDEKLRIEAAAVTAPSVTLPPKVIDTNEQQLMPAIEATSEPVQEGTGTKSLLLMMLLVVLLDILKEE